MSEAKQNLKNRRAFIKSTGRIAAASALAGVVLPHVHAAENNTIQVALIGAGGRGNGAASNALSVKNGPIKLVAIADVFDARLQNSYSGLKSKFNDKVDVPDDRKFIGFDAYKKAMDCLKPGDVAIFTTPPAFRWVNYTYAIEKGLNVFMEKPVTVDGPTSRRMLELNKQAQAKNLKVGVGLMSRHSRSLQEVHQRIQDGEIGDIVLMRGYRMHGPVGTFSSLPKPEGMNETLYQIQRFHSFLWASGGCYSDFYIHHVDHCCWMKNGWPVKAQGIGGRHYRQSPDGAEFVDQNFDSYSVEYTFEDGSKFYMDGRCMTGTHPIYSSYAHGSKGCAILANKNDCDPPSRTFKGQNFTKGNMIWEYSTKPDDEGPYQNEWNVLIDAIRNNKPHNEVERGVYASAVTSLGRMSAHMGQELTLEQFMASDHEYAPGLDKITLESPAPLQVASNGKYPVPQPGLKKREY